MNPKFKKPYVRKMKASGKHLTKVQKAEVKKLVAAPVETKYVAQIVDVYGGGLPAVPAQGFGVLQNIISGGSNFQAWNLVPQLIQGVAGNQRIGNKITDVTLKSTWQFYINPQLALFQTIDATVKVFIVKSKSVKALSAIQRLSAGSLLDNGDGTSIDWLPATPLEAKSYDMYPVNKEEFTVVKTHKFRLAKNFDSPTGGTAVGSAPNMTSHQSKDFSHSLRHRGALIYPDNNLPGFALPTNFMLVAYVVCWDTNTFAPLPASSILCNSRSHMYYKD